MAWNFQKFLKLYIFSRYSAAPRIFEMVNRRRLRRKGITKQRERRMHPQAIRKWFKLHGKDNGQCDAQRKLGPSSRFIDWDASTIDMLGWPNTSGTHQQKKQNFVFWMDTYTKHWDPIWDWNFLHFTEFNKIDETFFQKTMWISKSFKKLSIC